MRKKNGTTIIELVISISMISIIIIMMFSILINVKTEDSSNNIKSLFLINQAKFEKEIEEDIIDYGLLSISNCDVSIENINIINSNDSKCLSLEFKDKSVGRIMVYTQQIEDNKTADLLTYIHNNNRISKELPSKIDFDKKVTVDYTAFMGNNANNAGLITFPIVNASDNEHYDLKLPFTFKGVDYFRIYPDNCYCKMSTIGGASNYCGTVCTNWK